VAPPVGTPSVYVDKDGSPAPGETGTSEIFMSMTFAELTCWVGVGDGIGVGEAALPLGEGVGDPAPPVGEGFGVAPPELPEGEGVGVAPPGLLEGEGMGVPPLDPGEGVGVPLPAPPVGEGVGEAPPPPFGEDVAPGVGVTLGVGLAVGSPLMIEPPTCPGLDRGDVEGEGEAAAGALALGLFLGTVRTPEVSASSAHAATAAARVQQSNAACARPFLTVRRPRRHPWPRRPRCKIGSLPRRPAS